MTYTLNIKGMHCSGCKNLIQLNLEDAGFKNIMVDQENNCAVIDADWDDLTKVQELLDKTFADMPDYHYSNLKVVNTP